MEKAAPKLNKDSRIRDILVKFLNWLKFLSNK